MIFLGDSLDFNAGDAGVAVDVDDRVLLRAHAVREVDGGVVGEEHLEFLWGEGDDDLGRKNRGRNIRRRRL